MTGNNPKSGALRGGEGGSRSGVRLSRTANPVAPSLAVVGQKDVLELLSDKGAKPGEVAKRLKQGGGGKKMYAALSPNRKGNARVADDLEMLLPGIPEDEVEDGGPEVEVMSEGAQSDDVD